jgi:hypothetical protein
MQYDRAFQPTVAPAWRTKEWKAHTTSRGSYKPHYIDAHPQNTIVMSVSGTKVHMRMSAGRSTWIGVISGRRVRGWAVAGVMAT